MSKSSSTNGKTLKASEEVSSKYDPEAIENLIKEEKLSRLKAMERDIPE